MRRGARNFDAYTHQGYALADFRARALALAAPNAFQPLDLEHVELAVAHPCARAAGFLSFFGKRKLIMQKLPERAGSARSRADRVPIPRVEGVEAARNRDFGDLDVFWSADEDLVSAKSASSGRDHVLDIVCGSMNKARPFVFALRAVAYDPNVEIVCGNGRGIVLDGVVIHVFATDAVCCIFSSRKHDLRRAADPPRAQRQIAAQLHSGAPREFLWRI